MIRALRTFATSMLLCVAFPAIATIPAAERQVLLDLYTKTQGGHWTTSTNWNGAVGTECTWFGVTCDGGSTHVQTISLDKNNLVGSLPNLTALPQMTAFTAQSNQLSGSIPSLAGLTNLTNFNVTDNQLTGSIPSLAGLTGLVDAYFGLNLLTGPIPTLSGVGLNNLSNFDTYHNQLTGPIPSLSGLTKLSSFNVASNQLSGPIPALTGLSNLAVLYVDYNQLSGPVPSLAGLNNLQRLYINNNQLSGSLPSLAGLGNLQQLQISSNQLSGTLPANAFAGLNQLIGIGMGKNNFTGPLPNPGPGFTAGNSTVCPNLFDRSSSAAWDDATGHSPWYRDCAYVVTTTLSAGGGISPQSPMVLPDQKVTFTITALPGFYTVSASDNCSPGGNPTSRLNEDGKTYTISKISADCTLTVTFSNAIINGVCGSDNGKSLAVPPTNLCSAGSPSTPGGGAPGGNWTWFCYGINGGGTGTCSATVKTWTVRGSTGAEGVVLPAAQGIIDGHTTTLTVTASPDYQIASVSGCGGSLGADNKTYTTGPITADCTVTASFLSIIPPSFGVCGSDNGKTLAAAPTNLCATGTASGVNGDGHPWTWTCSGTIPPPAFCSATIQTWTVSASAGSGGAITPAAQTVDNGKTAVLSVTPVSGYAIASVAGCGGSLGADGKTYTTGGVTADCAVSAAFAPISLTPTMTTLILTPNPAAVNQPVNATVTVSGATMGAAFPVATAANAPKPLAVAGGSVSVTGGGQTCTVTLVNGSGSCTLSFGIAGNYAIVASYAGDATFAPSSASANLTVNASVPQQSVPAPMLDWRTMLLLAIALCTLSPYGRNVIRRHKRKSAA